MAGPNGRGEYFIPFPDQRGRNFAPYISKIPIRLADGFWKPLTGFLAQKCPLSGQSAMVVPAPVETEKGFFRIGTKGDYLRIKQLSHPSDTRNYQLSRQVMVIDKDVGFHLRFAYEHRIEEYTSFSRAS